LRHSKLAPAEGEENLKVIDVALVMSSGCASSEVCGGAGAVPVPTVHCQLAGEPSASPASLCARASKRCAPGARPS